MIIRLLAKLLLSALSLLLISYYIPGIMVSSFYIALVLALIFGVMNVTIKPILILLTLPITLLTFGLFTLVINGFLFWLASTFVQGFEVSGFLSAFLGALALTVLSWLSEKLIKD
jgi:putative membrane protein